ncbi:MULTISPECIES: DNA mismatch repair protein MutT [unclassified Streptococcus]
MPKTENVVLTNMCMVTDGTKVLVQNRKDPDWPGLVYPGGDCVIIMTGA